MQRESLHCGELIKRLNDILGRCANEELRADDMTSSQVKKNGFFQRFLLMKKKNYTVCYKKYTMM